MSEDVGVKINASKVNLKLERMPEDVRNAVRDAVISIGGPLVDAARSRAESLLQVRTGKFVKAIRFSLRQRKNSITGRVSSSAKTAHLFEWGGKTGAHEILPKKANALLIGGEKFAARVKHPGGTYAARNIIHGAFDPKRAEIAAKLESAVSGAAARASE